jgi:hypothetical protein
MREFREGCENKILKITRKSGGRNFDARLLMA